MFLDINDFCASLKSNLSSEGISVAVAADNDLDGLFSAIILDMGLYNLFNIEVETFFRDELRWEIPLENKYDILILVDLAYDNTPNYRAAASKAKQTFAIDHHITSETGFPQRVTVYNPCKDGQCYLPATFLTNKILKTMGSETNPLFGYLNLIGVLADAGINFKVREDRTIIYYYDVELTSTFQNGQTSFEDLFHQKQFENFVYPYFKEVIEALSFEGAEEGWKELYLRFINEVTDLLAAQNLINKIVNKNKEEFLNVVRQVPKKPTEMTKSGIWLVKNTSSIGNGIIGRVISELLGQPVVTYSCQKFCRVSARAPSDSDLNFIPIFSGFGGGHPKACGAFLTQNQFNAFYEKLMEN
ncbi:MAG: DHH family phosphoesterase [Candidatus Thorarchaeota archaeon]